MAIALDDFLHSLCRALATAAGLKYVGDDTADAPRTLWRSRAAVAKADTYTVVRYSGGSADYDPIPRRSFQFWTVGRDREAALNQSQKLFEALLSPADGRPVRMLTIAGYKAADNTSDGHWRINSSDPNQPPSPLGPNAEGREQISWNTDVAFIKKD